MTKKEFKKEFDKFIPPPIFECENARDVIFNWAYREINKAEKRGEELARDWE